MEKQKFGFSYMKFKSGPGAELLRQGKSDKYDFIFTNWYTYPVVCQWWNNRRPHWLTENLLWLVSSKKTKLAIFPALQYKSGNFTVVGFLAFFFDRSSATPSYLTVHTVQE